MKDLIRYSLWSVVCKGQRDKMFAFPLSSVRTKNVRRPPGKGADPCRYVDSTLE